MSSAGDRRRSSMKSQISDPVPLQLCGNMKAEASDGETLEETLEVSEVKKEETLELKIDDYEDDLDNTPEDISVKEEDPDIKNYLYCEICKSIFFNKCEVHGPPLFIPDTPAPMGVTERARQTLPPGLEIQKSGIPNAGLGVFNTGETVPVGAHFGPYQGELVDREEAMNSGYSWVICRGRQGEKYIDAKREMHANWMRFVNCACDDEQNLVAFQYQGGILYRCCRPINPGQELLVWYEEKYAKELSPAFNQLWDRKCFTNEINNAQVQVFSCSTCPLSSSSQIYLDKHIQSCHYEENVRLQEPQEIKYEIQVISKDSSSQPSSSDILSSDTHKCIRKKMIHHCTACEKNFGHQDALKTHQCSQAGEKPHCCSQCGKRFSKRINLHKHQRIHTGKKPHQCSQCGKSFTLPSAVLVHQRIHTGEKPYRCSQCGKSFNQKSNLHKHQIIHTGEKPYHCSKCRKSFTQHSHLQRHRCIHKGEKLHHCTQCGKGFTYAAAFQKHQCIQIRERTYHCSQCVKSFFHLSALLVHQRIHTGERPYQCSDCGKSFSRQSALQRHQHIHTGEKPYHCSHCGKSFTLKDAVLVHQRIHTGEKPYQCSECGRSFTQQSALLSHQVIHSQEKPYDCSQCGKSFNLKSHLKRHQRVHTGEKPYHCSQCGKSFSYPSGFQKHQRIHKRETT
ncbi:uncharacterized protein Hap1MRO34_014875 [Clarias gariepinus]